MLSCKEISKLVSQSLDRKLSLRQRLGLWLHICMCGLCWRFRKDIIHLHKETREHAHQAEQDSEQDSEQELELKLSDESRDRMKRLIESQQ